MPYEKLVNYIKEQLDNGFTDEQIKQVLSKSGYKQEIIDQGFSLAHMVASDAEPSAQPFGDASQEHLQQAPFEDSQEHHEGVNKNKAQQQVKNQLLGSQQQSPQAKVQAQTSSVSAQIPRYNALAIFGFLFSITLFISFIGFILSGIALVKLKKGGYQEKGKGLAMTGLILGFVFTVVPIVFLLVVLSSLKTYLNYSPI